MEPNSNVRRAVRARRLLATPCTRSLLVLAALCRPLAAQAPPPPTVPDRDAVLSVVQGFFDTMAAKDVDGARRLLVPEGTFNSVRRQDGRPLIRSFTNQAYLKDLPGNPQRLRERIWSPEVRIHGDLAAVWAPYDFWRDGKLSHCGVDAFDLIRTTEGWKIAGGAYTVETECAESPLGPLK